uniref:Fibrinogen C-terminal domain-containing protein n=1 Tax=Acrobeloides nanus TaxID=290746 RepID=A0A914CWB8_9BILA
MLCLVPSFLCLLQKFGTCSYYWLGGRWNSGNYQWADGSSFNYTHFGPGDENKDKACIDIHTGTSNWHTNDCQQQECFICEKNADEPSNRASDCKQLMSQGQTASGVYTIYVNGAPKTVYCDMQTDGGGWTVIQQRVNGAVSFWDQTWQAYKNGFGVAGAATEFWAGNDLIHQLTTQTSGNILRVDLWGDRNPNSTNPNIYLTSNYNFSLNDESTEYTPNIWSTFPGVGNASTGWYDITYINGTKFSTIDHINDPMQTCVTDYHLGGWWLHYCTTSSLNGQYIPPISYGNGYGMFWVVNGYEIINPTKSKMMIRSI